jgi:multiple sugar transport system substrate-binding protein
MGLKARHGVVERRQSNKTMRCLARISFAGILLAGTVARAVTELNYWLWDQYQLPVYRACADEFEKQNPDIKIKITQTGWSDYWSALNRAFIFGVGPDVLTNHVAGFPELIAYNLLVDIGPLIARDKISTDVYFSGLFKIWGKDGKQYGLPKDWGTVAMVYNKLMLEKAGIDPKSLLNLHWNPKNGGSFGQLVAQLSIDANGKNGLEADFKPKNVRQYGLLIRGQPDGFGPVEWSHLAISNGFKFYDGPWSRHFYYDDPKLAETIQWMADTELNKGYIVPAQDARESGAPLLFAAQKGALAFVGSGDINWCKENCQFEIGFAPLPEGPVGHQAVLFPGLADSIWVGSKHQEEAWKWVKFLASSQAQKIVGGSGLALPAIPEATELAKDALAKRGIDITFYISEAADPNPVFLLPISFCEREILRITDPAFDLIFFSGEDAGKTLKAANEKVNALFN